MTDAWSRVTEVPALPARPVDAHKHRMGRVVIVAGSRGMTGAAVLCGLGALRGGAGLVRVVCGESVQQIVASSEPCLMTSGVRELPDGLWDAADPQFESALAWATVIAIGPGLGSMGASIAWAKCVAASQPLVVDADALAMVAGANASAHVAEPRVHRPASHPLILTPHQGEFNRLRAALAQPPLADHAPEAERIRAALELAGVLKAIVVLKGPNTVVADSATAAGPARAYVNSTGNAGMAAGGMGDVLTGAIAALIGQGMPPFDAACLAVWAHGLSADGLAHRIGPTGYLAREVADGLPAVIASASSPRVGYR